MSKENLFKDFRDEYWFHVSDQNEMPIYGRVTKSINVNEIYTLSHKMPNENKLSYIESCIKINVDCIETLRSIVGVTDKRFYLEVSYLLYRDSYFRENVHETSYRFKKYGTSQIKNLIRSTKNALLSERTIQIVSKYLMDKGAIAMLSTLQKLTKTEILAIVQNIMLPKEIQQEETKRRGHGAEQALAKLLNDFGVDVIPENKYENPMGSQDPNVDKKTFKLSKRKEGFTWSMDIIIKQDDELRIFVQGLVHSSDPGQYGVNKSAETLQVKEDLKKWNEQHSLSPKKELWGLVDGVGFIENPENTLFKMIGVQDLFVQLKSLYKAGLQLHKLGIVTIKGIRFDNDFYSTAEAQSMYEKYANKDICLVMNQNDHPDWKEIQAGKAWLYI